MPRRSKRETSSGSNASITTFLFGDESTQKHEEPSESKVDSIASDLLSFIAGRGGVGKDELMNWGKERGLTPARLLPIIEELTAKRLIIKKLDEKGKLIYRSSKP
ncbi:MAG: hypothetical protein ACP5NY_05165 [Thermocladium sp.]